MRERTRLVLSGLIAAAALACQGAPVPLSVQKGATFLVPLGGIADLDAGRIGFGSAIYEDRQRGALVFTLDAPNGPALVTRATTALGGPIASPAGFASPFGSRTDLIVSIVDVPDAPEITEGSHALYAVRRRNGVDQSSPIALGRIDVLPASVPSTGGAIAGRSTPFEIVELPGFDASTYVAKVVPAPQVVFAATAAARAVELEITYPSAQIDVRDVTEAQVQQGTGTLPGVSLSHRALAWWSVRSPGVLAVGMLHPERGLRGISVVFDLKAGTTQPIGPTSVQIRNARAYGADGEVVAAGWTDPWIR